MCVCVCVCEKEKEKEKGVCVCWEHSLLFPCFCPLTHFLAAPPPTLTSTKLGAGHPMHNAKRVRLVCSGQYMRVFNADTLRHAMSQVLGSNMDKGKKALMHAVSMCQADVLLDPNDHDRGVVRIHYRAAAAEMARCFDAILDVHKGGKKRRATVVETLGGKWHDLNTLAATRPISRPPTPVREEMPQGHEPVPFEAPTGREPLFCAEDDPPPEPPKRTSLIAPVPAPPANQHQQQQQQQQQQQKVNGGPGPLSTAPAAAAPRVQRSRGGRKASVRFEVDESKGANVADFRQKLRRTSNVRVMEATPEMHAAATRVQAVVRGFLDRAEIRARKNKARRRTSFMFFNQQAPQMVRLVLLACLLVCACVCVCVCVCVTN